MTFFLTGYTNSKGQKLFTQEGYATYYSDWFQGRRTSSGDRYDKMKYTAAHASLPLNTYVKVTTKKNNKSIIVKVNDRCARNKSRILDLSKVAATELGILSSGIAMVTIEEIKDTSLYIGKIDSISDSLRLKKTRLLITSNNLEVGYYNKDLSIAVPKGYGVVAASYRYLDDVLNASEICAEKYKQPLYLQSAYIRNRKLYIIVLGEYVNKFEADTMKAEFTKEFSDCFVVKYK
jgi:rare lipoprotein A